MTNLTLKGNRMIAMSTPRPRPASWLVALCAPAAVLLMLPSSAIAADAGASTVRANLGSDGAVKDVKVFGPDGASSAFSGKLPVTLAVTRSASGGSTVLSYHVENVASKTQDVSYTDTAGKTHTTQVELQLPLVAQLGVTLPSSMKEVSAPGATISTDPNGTRHVLWQMVLFTPLGSAAQDVSLTAAGDGTPSAQLRATAVDPSSAAGVSSAAQAANQSITQDDFWAGFASGGNDGLTKLRAGMAQLVAGLELLAPGAKTLASGLGAAGDGANKLAAGTDKAKDGAGLLSAGLVKISKGQTDLAAGLKLIHDGQVALTGGLTQLDAGAGALSTGIGQIHDGQVSLTGGIGQIHDGQGALTTGLGALHTGQGDLSVGLSQISGGLGQLAATATGLPAAAAGLAQIQAGVSALTAGVGTSSDATPATLLGGVNLIAGGLAQLKTGVINASFCASDILGKVMLGAALGTPDTCFPSTGNVVPLALTGTNTTDPAASAILSSVKASYDAIVAGTDTTFTPGVAALSAGVAAIKAGLSHAASSGDPGGVREGLASVAGGIGLVQTGVGLAIGGVNALNTGAGAALAGSYKLTDGSAAALSGSQKLTDGSAAALSGSQKLVDGSGAALVGSKALAAGADAALAGSKKLTAGSGSALAGAILLRDGAGQAVKGSQDLVLGLGQLSVGQHQVADGLPAAVSGAAQISDGLAQVLTGGTAIRDGIGQAQDGAVGPLSKQLAEASQNARKQVAILAAAGTLASSAPDGAGATYVLDQSPFDPKLAAATTTTTGDHMARNVGIGVGGALLLVVGLAGGFLAGRRRLIAAP